MVYGPSTRKVITIEKTNKVEYAWKTGNRTNGMTPDCYNIMYGRPTVIKQATKDMLLTLALETAFGEGLFKVILPSCQVWIRVCLEISEQMDMRS